MTAAEGWADAVRARLRPGRLLPLGAPEDGAWLTEQAAEKVLRRAAKRVPGVLPGLLRVGLADPGSAGTPTVPAPPAALPPGLLRIEAEFAAIGAVPLAEPAGLLREALFTAAEERLGLRISAVDLRITALLEVPPAPAGPQETEAAGAEAERTVSDGAQQAGAQKAGAEAAGTGTDRTEAAGARAADRAGEPGRPAGAEPKGGRGRGDTAAGACPGAGSAGRPGAVAAATAAAAAVPGVARLTGLLGAAVRADDSSVRVECATEPGHRPLEVARAVRAAVITVLPTPLPVAVLVTEVGLGD
ncbi:hypothetical protein SCWH03_15240 [Streptomyces pacificus]|uniref:Nucleopolyhedrovirus P10 family protein n=2 Tax=Streptomyces pacificus TaxID=2705029 RepID=A0A6A0AQN2_9ACTN|nr:hypothetical protein SCWH03_15240 [Streptomyces pacificus]